MRHLVPRALCLSTTLLLGLPASAAGHTLTERYEAPLPLVAHIAGAALAVAMSFAFVMLRTPRPPGGTSDGRPEPRTVPAWLRHTLSAIGLLAWAWILAQGLLGGAAPTGDVGYLFLWVYGWIGVALLSAVVGPAWAWLDPFSTLHRLLSAAGRRLGLLGERPRYAPYPARLAIWPAVVGFLVIVWLELVAFVLGGRMLALLLLAYTLFTLAGMSYYGRAAWRANGEVFGVWFGLLGRLAPLRLIGEPEEGLVERRPFGAGLLRERWTVAQVVLVAIGAAAIIYDGLSQTRPYFDLFGQLDLFGLPDVMTHTVVMLALLGLLAGMVLWVGRQVGLRPIGAGLLPVAVGYLAAHYIVALLVDGQAIVNAVNDPWLRGDSLLPGPWSRFEPDLLVPISLVWSFQLAAVVGGHMLGAWTGHAAIEAGAETETPNGEAFEAPSGGRRLRREVVLAGLMIGLTTVTLWSLGQEVIVG
ncbi:MAG TPA: hypothetical protein VM305_01430 [Candidatus Limnocylindrales bacterium]|nr:hypothetical protein [Candidatus Limnocylindrales bacterium]